MNLVLERVYRVCNTVRQQHREPISFKKLVASVRKSFKDYGFDIAFKTIKTSELAANEFYVEAYYYEEKDFNDDPPVEVNIYHCFEQVQRFQSNQIREFLIQIYDAVVHEFRHQHQYQNRDFEHYTTSKDGYAAYLADPDEVDAYAFSIAIELLRAMPKHRASMYMTRLNTLSKMKQNGMLVSPNLNSYVGHFKGNALLKRLAKKVYKHIEGIDSDLIFK